jgi:hypothetical protein
MTKRPNRQFVSAFEIEQHRGNGMRASNRGVEVCSCLFCLAAASTGCDDAAGKLCTHVAITGLGDGVAVLGADLRLANGALVAVASSQKLPSCIRSADSAVVRLQWLGFVRVFRRIAQRLCGAWATASTGRS